MLKYLVIVLDDMSVAYCHYSNMRRKRQLISLDNLKAGISFAMKENLSIQFVYPSFEIPDEYRDLISTVDNYKIMPFDNSIGADVVILDCCNVLGYIKPREDVVYVIKAGIDDLILYKKDILNFLAQAKRLDLVITDIEKFDEEFHIKYNTFLTLISNKTLEILESGKSVQINVITDRLMLNKMNNCNAGWESITLAPDGQFYICPAFYFDAKGCSEGSLSQGLNIKNRSLYGLNHSPICRECDAYHCKRCLWLNRKRTLEINIPSHEQCVVSHIERNVSMRLGRVLQTKNIHIPVAEIKEIDYMDPFDKIKNI